MLIFLQHCANLFPAGANQFNMIHLAACQKNPTSLEVIAAHCSKVELEKPDENGRSPLMYATMMGLEKNVQILMGMEVCKIYNHDTFSLQNISQASPANNLVEGGYILCPQKDFFLEQAICPANAS